MDMLGRISDPSRVSADDIWHEGGRGEESSRRGAKSEVGHHVGGRWHYTRRARGMNFLQLSSLPSRVGYKSPQSKGMRGNLWGPSCFGRPSRGRVGAGILASGPKIYLVA